MATKNLGGRPREGESVKRAPLNLRTSPELREKIEEAADANGYSLTQEVERRLISSFNEDMWMGGAHIRTFVKMLGASIDQVETKTGKKWTQDRETWEAVAAVAMRLLRWDRPIDPIEAELQEAAKHYDTSIKRQEAARQALDGFRAGLGMQSIGGVASDAPTFSKMGGLFGGGGEWVDARAGWTDEQRQEEERLVRVLQEATKEAAASSARVGETLNPFAGRIGRAREMGEEMAEEWFHLLGPKPKPAVK